MKILPLIAAAFVPRSTHRTSSIVCHAEGGSEKYDTLVQWLRESGATVSDKIDIRPSSMGGYGCFVSEAVETDELLFAIPRNLCLTLDDAINDEACGPFFKTLIEKAGPGGNTVALAGYMAKERLRSLASQYVPQTKDSRFGPYLAVLPWERGVNNQEHTLYWSDEDIETSLKGSMCYREAKDLRDEVELATSVLERIVAPAIQEYRGEKEEDGFWPWEKAPPPQGPVEGLPEAVTGAFVSVLTRAFQDDGDDMGDDADAEKMVPLLDMLQHSDEPNVRHAMRKDTGAVEVRARMELPANVELLNLYRSEEEENMPYYRFFSRFGFVPGITEPIENLLADKSSIFFAQKAEV